MIIMLHNVVHKWEIEFNPEEIINKLISYNNLLFKKSSDEEKIQKSKSLMPSRVPPNTSDG